ncbi:hypothetical protein F8154_05650 [Alkaliphilus pronyensis]|uniref:Uncharacterized protein n=1 Tax=Alkaliphilus pronyensis TaxID=1482732 RepID=A0A6I0FAE7_9FIRM|nr:hypothetical protein [Alkaliphilus pronyensis]KAB3535784.1 hypothetical protein F8154_05650 [Alkaliphilus pronyensis]
MKRSNLSKNPVILLFFTVLLVLGAYLIVLLIRENKEFIVIKVIFLIQVFLIMLYLLNRHIQKKAKNNIRLYESNTRLLEGLIEISDYILKNTKSRGFI